MQSSDDIDAWDDVSEPLRDEARRRRRTAGDDSAAMSNEERDMEAMGTIRTSHVAKEDSRRLCDETTDDGGRTERRRGSWT